MCVMGFDPMCHMCVIIYKDGFFFQSTIFLRALLNSESAACENRFLMPAYRRKLREGYSRVALKKEVQCCAHKE